MQPRHPRPKFIIRLHSLGNLNFTMARESQAFTLHGICFDLVTVHAIFLAAFLQHLLFILISSPDVTFFGALPATKYKETGRAFV